MAEWPKHTCLTSAGSPTCPGCTAERAQQADLRSVLQRIGPSGRNRYSPSPIFLDETGAWMEREAERLQAFSDVIHPSLYGWVDEAAHYAKTGELFPADAIQRLDDVDTYLTMLDDPDQQEE